MDVIGMDLQVFVGRGNIAMASLVSRNNNTCIVRQVTDTTIL